MALMLLAAAGLLAGCADTRRALIKEKGAPDEFEVYTRAPLSLPPDYKLRPPADGSEVRPEDDTSRKARVVLTRQGTQTPTSSINASSPGLGAIYARTGADRADADIRNRVNSESDALASSDLRVLERILYEDELRQGTALDPEKEAQRIRENTIQGIPINEGELPTIERKKRGLLDGILN